MILVKGNAACNGGLTPSVNVPKSAGISVFHCDILNNEDLEKFSQTVQDSFGGIDIVIDNATNNIFETMNSDDCRTFIDVTSGKLRTTINVSFMVQIIPQHFFHNDFNSFCSFVVHFQMLMHFVPKIKYSKCGHFVTIQPIISNKKPLLSSYGEIKSLINILTDNQSTFALDLFNRQQKIHLTTVMWNCDTAINTNGTNCNGNNNNVNGGHSEIKRASERIIDGIKANRSVVNIDKSFNLLNSIRNYFHKKSTNIPNANCNDHIKVSWYVRHIHWIYNVHSTLNVRNQTHNFSFWIRNLLSIRMHSLIF